MRTGVFLAITALGILLAGSACVGLGNGNSPETRYFLLAATSTTVPGPTRPRQTTELAIGIGPVRVPRYLDRPQVITRLNDRELRVDDFNHWAEPLKVSIPRVMGENLSALTGGSRVRTFPWKSSERLDYRVSVDIHRFEADADGEAMLIAIWRMASVEDRQLSTERRSVIEKASMGTGAGGIVAGLSLALADLSQEIATELTALNHQLKKQSPGVPE